MCPLKPATLLGFLTRKAHFLLLSKAFLLFFAAAIGQTNISGVVNSYYKVVEVIPSKACVRLNTVTGLARLQKTLLIQMKGASVITTNNSSFGDTTSLNNAGNYEVAIICSINGDSVFMFHNFLNTYTVTDKVQLVKFAQYYSANVLDTIKASPWNNTNGTGGVIAISVSQTLSLNAPIVADAVGFNGGGYVLSSGTCFNAPFDATAYFYNGSSTNPQNGAYKGESVYDFPITQSGGRGAPANGGGGGNNHNNGGAGGANLAAGGKGGGNSSSAGCTTDLHGDAGKALKNWSGKKIFLGGGGGAGHSNGTLTISNGGGNGGGIIFVQAETLVGNGYKISANGGTGGNAVSDGASGGGGAGSIIMDVLTYSGLLTIQASGGKGGDENDAGTSQRCYGAGGGGSGGVLYFTGSVPAISTSVSGGAAGLEYGSDPACNAAVPAVGGSNGTTISPYTIRQSTDSSIYCLSIPLAVHLIYFQATKNTSNIQLQWSVTDPQLAKEFVIEKLDAGNWVPLSTIPADGSEQNYSYTDGHPNQSSNSYRLKVIENDGSFFYSPIRRVNGEYNDLFVVYPNPASQQVTITGNFSPYTEIKLFDLSGKIAWQGKISRPNASITIDISFLPKGVYVLQVDKVNKRLVVNR